MRRIEVVGAVIVRAGLVLCAQRGPGRLAGLWEFPGGKVEPGESLAEALEREIAEELLCQVRVDRRVTSTDHDDSPAVRLTTYRCELVSGEPQATEHAALAWLPPEKLDTLDWAPADLPAVELISSGLR